MSQSLSQREVKFDDHVFLHFFYFYCFLILKILWYIHIHRSCTFSIGRILFQNDLRFAIRENPLHFTLRINSCNKWLERMASVGV